MSDTKSSFFTSRNYKWFVLATLTIVSALNFFDRQLIVILQEPIKAELDLTDTQLGLVTGLAFAVFYSLLGIPIARFADKNSRRNVIGAALAVWSIMTSLTGYIQNFFQLILVRIGVGIGETGSYPSSYAIISDYFPINKRATAYAVLSTGVYIGLFASFLSGGYLENTWGWRNTFIYLGIPGVLLSIFLFLTIKEPKKNITQDVNDSKGLLDALHFLSTRRTFFFLCLGSMLHSFVGYGFANWMPSFLIRVHGMTLIEAGFWLAIAVGIGGGLGAFCGGLLADKLAKNDKRWYLWLAIWAIVLSIPFSLFTLFSSNGMAAAICYFIPNFFFSFNSGGLITIIMGVVPAKMRSVTGAVYLFFLNLVGLGLGPLAVGALSDYFAATNQDTSLRYALFIVSNVYLLSTYLYWRAAKHVREEMVYS